MKLFVCILSFIILGLTVMPCIDGAKDGNGHKNECSQGTDNNQQNEPGHCSPFCTCQCCQANCCIAEYAVVTTPVSLEIVRYEIALNFQCSELFDFFIPPKA